MNAAPIIVARRAIISSIRLSCPRSLFRRFTSSSRLAVAEFQSYRLNPQPATPPRSAGGPDTSITHPIDPPMPRVHETRPLKTIPQTTAAMSIREELAQQSQAAFAPPPEQQQQTRSQPQEDAAPAAMPNETPTPTAEVAAAPTPEARPRSKLRAPRKAAMQLAPTAVAQLRALLDKPEPKLIKVGVRNRGCSGLAYHLEYVDKAGPFDEAVEQDGVKVLIDSKALFSIIGSVMQWEEDKLNARFTFRNPNVKEQCGCGESFMV